MASAQFLSNIWRCRLSFSKDVAEDLVTKKESELNDEPVGTSPSSRPGDMARKPISSEHNEKLQTNRGVKYEACENK